MYNPLEGEKKRSKERVRGQFRSVRDGPKNTEGKYVEDAEAIDMKATDSENLQAKNIKKLESGNALVYIAQSEDQSERLLMTAHKDDDEGHLNSRKGKQIDMNRAKPTFKRSHTTHTEGLDESFLQKLKPGESKDRFYRYLEELSESPDADAVNKVFPFLSIKSDRRQLSQLKDQRSQAHDDEKETITIQIEALEQKIYDNLLKRALFKKRILELAAQEQPSPLTEQDETHWLWLLLKRLKQLLEETLEDGDDDEEVNNGVL